jgi:hypothetical protein
VPQRLNLQQCPKTCEPAQPSLPALGTQGSLQGGGWGWSGGLSCSVLLHHLHHLQALVRHSCHLEHSCNAVTSLVGCVASTLVCAAYLQHVAGVLLDSTHHPLALNHLLHCELHCELTSIRSSMHPAQHLITNAINKVTSRRSPSGWLT